MRLSESDLKWIETHLNDDVNRLRLKHGHDPARSWLITQIEARQKGARKVGEELERFPGFVFPTVLSAEQCTADPLARFHSSLLPGGARVLDMTCGLGIDVFHAASRQCHVTTFDIDPRVVEAMRINAGGMGLSGCIEAFTGDSVEALRGDGSAVYDVIFVDPARRGEGGRRLYAMTDCSPDVVTNIELIMSRCKRLIIKASPMLDVTEARRGLARAGEVDILTVGTTAECKELVVILPGSGRLTAVTIDGERVVTEDFGSVNRISAGEYRQPEAGMFMYDPYPAVTKAGCYGALAAKYDMFQPGENVHLFISPQKVDTFPGDRFEIETVVSFSKREVARLLGVYGQLSVTTRNFPLKAAEFKKRFKTGESSSHRLWAITSSRGKTLLVTRRV